MLIIRVNSMYFGRRLSVLAVLLCIWASSPAGERFEQGLLWRIQAPDTAPSYLFGTIHVEDSRVTQLPAEVSRALADSKLFAGELILTPDITLQLAMAMRLPEGQTLSNRLGQPLFDQVLPSLARYHLDQHSANHLSIWAVTLMLNLPPAETGLMLDAILQIEARKLEIPLLSLETVGEQIQIFASLSEADQITLLKLTLNNLSMIDDLLEKLISLYLQRDLAGLEQASAEMMGVGPPELTARLIKTMIDDRNLIMAKRMQALIKEGGAFIAVGALHLPGEQGILKLLSEQFQIERVY